jgi:hypothetical protein
MNGTKRRRRIGSTTTMAQQNALALQCREIVWLGNGIKEFIMSSQ